MNTTLKYLAIITALAGAALAYSAGATWAGVLSTIAGILVGVTIIRKDTKE